MTRLLKSFTVSWANIHFMSNVTATPNLFANPVRLLAPMEGLTDPLMRQILTQIAGDGGRAYDCA